MFNKLIILFLLTTGSAAFAQGVDISDYLKKIESGNKDEVKAFLPRLKSQNLNDANVLFLEGVLTENGQESVTIFSKVADKYPQSKYADASLFRVYSYYYALQQFDSASSYIERLKKEYPLSPYIKIAEKNTVVIDENNTERPAIDPLPPKKLIKKTETNVNYKFTIQAGAFTSKDNAEALKKQFEDAGINSEVKDKDVAGTTFHVVYAGKFVIEKDAKDFLQNINSQYSLDGRVVKLTP